MGSAIDLYAAGAGTGSLVTANDFPDSDTGANNLQNYPVLTASPSQARARAWKASWPATRTAIYVLDFYRNSAVDPSGFGEGESYLGFINVRTNAQGRVNFTFPLDANANGQYITATATDSGRQHLRVFAGERDCARAHARPTPTPTAAPTPAPLLANISTRLRVETGNNLLIGGFIVAGSGAEEADCARNRAFVRHRRRAG